MAQWESIRFASERPRVRIPPRPPEYLQPTFCEVKTTVKDLLCDGFQETVDQCLMRHRSVLDIMSKLTESASRVNRAVSKAVTACGCIQVEADRQKIPPEVESLELMKTHMSTHLKGSLCDNCAEVLEDEIGRTLFYLAALCNLSDLRLHDVLVKERERIDCLGRYNFT